MQEKREGILIMKDRNDAIVEIIINKVKEEYKEDVSLLCCYGSYINGTAHEMSDVDFYFVPKTDRAHELTKTFILDGIGYDFWGISWDRLEKISDFDEPLVSLVADCKIVYCCSEEDEKRFADLQSKIKKTMQEPANERMLQKAEKHITSAMSEYCKVALSRDIADIRQSSGMILMNISDAVALMNNRYFAYGIKKQLSEILKFTHLPVDFEQLYSSIIHADTYEDNNECCLKIINNTYSLWKELLESIQTKGSPKDALAGLYEEICSTWNKIYMACDQKDAAVAFLAGTCLQKELDYISAICTFPSINLMGAFRANDLMAFKEAAKQSEEIMRNQLKKEDVYVKVYASVEEFKLEY